MIYVFTLTMIALKMSEITYGCTDELRFLENKASCTSTSTCHDKLSSSLIGWNVPCDWKKWHLSANILVGVICYFSDFSNFERDADAKM